jgi:phosphotransferase system HPr-like phosphotransfer protein
MLNWDLSQLHSSIHIQSDERVINGKSLLGILSAQYKMGDIITVIFDDERDLNKIKEIFNELGGEYNG